MGGELCTGDTEAMAVVSTNIVPHAGCGLGGEVYLLKFCSLLCSKPIGWVGRGDCHPNIRSPIWNHTATSLVHL